MMSSKWNEVQDMITEIGNDVESIRDLLKGIDDLCGMLENKVDQMERDEE